MDTFDVYEMEKIYSIFLVLGHRSYVCQVVFEITRQNKLRKCVYSKKSVLFCMKKAGPAPEVRN